MLDLLLQLSSKPTTTWRSDLDFLQPPEPEPEVRLRWEDLAAEDPLLREKEVWRTINYAGSSSEDEAVDSQIAESDVTDETALSSVDDENLRRLEDFLCNVDKAGFTRLQESQFWRESEKPLKDQKALVPLTGVQAIREILFMLLGLPTSLFQTAKADKRVVVPAGTFTLQNTSRKAFEEILEYFASSGTVLQILRSWSKSRQAVPLTQVLSSKIDLHVKAFERRVTEMESKFVAPSVDPVVSMIEVKTALAHDVELLGHLSAIVKNLENDPHIHAFRYLELLYNETCIAQAAGNTELYHFMGTLFCDCFQVYLRPMRKWMEDGEVENDDKTFFISESATSVERSSIWQDRFRLRRTQQGVLHAPSFLKTTINRIFTTGKSVVVLKLLGKYENEDGARRAQEPPLDFASISGTHQSGNLLDLAPFSELFGLAFDRWIESKHHTTSSSLHHLLFTNCGLSASLSALEHIYFLSDGSIGNNFSSAVFEMLDTGKAAWNDRFTLTELLQTVVTPISTINPERIRAKLIPTKYRDIVNQRRTVKALASIHIDYRLTWPVQIIITNDALTTYRSTFTLLFQIRRALYILVSPRLLSSASSTSPLFFALRARLLWFSTTLYSHLTEIVLATSTREMNRKLAKAVDVDEMISVHERYVEKIRNECLLSSRLEPIRKAVLGVLDLAVRLGDLRNVDERTQEDFRRSIGVGSSRFGMSGRGNLDFRSSRFSQSGRAAVVDESESESDGDGRDDVEFSMMSVTEAEAEVPYEVHLRRMRGEFDRGVRFVANGLRGVARVQGEASWDVLAEKLEVGLGPV